MQKRGAFDLSALATHAKSGHFRHSSWKREGLLCKELARQELQQASSSPGCQSLGRLLAAWQDLQQIGQDRQRKMFCAPHTHHIG
eukprot:107182-Amphidinium_carterae.1